VEELILLVADELFSEMLGGALHRQGTPVAVAPALGVGLLGLGEAGVPAGALAIHERALRDYDEPVLRGIYSMSPRPILVALTQSEPRFSVWDEVVPVASKTVNIAADLTARIAALAKARAEATEPPEQKGPIAIRWGDPWPTIRCMICAASRHFWKPRAPHEELMVRSQFPKFVLQHRACLATR